MNNISIIIQSIAAFLRSIARYIAIAFLGLAIGIAALWAYHTYFEHRTRTDFAAKVETIKTMVRHNSLELIDETIFTDTIDGICEVYSIKARINVSYNLEDMDYMIAGDTLIVELPKEKIEAHEISRRLLDEYYADGKLHFSSPKISGKQSNIIEEHMKEFVTTKMVSTDHIKRARQNELRNIAQLFHAIHGNVRVVLNINEPNNELSPTNIPLPTDI